MTTVTLNNLSTAGETIGSVLIVPPGPAWSITSCSPGPSGWTTMLASGACEYRSAPGTMDDIRAGARVPFLMNVSIPHGSTNASGLWEVRFARDEHVSLDSMVASGGEGGLGASVWVWEVLDAVVAATQVGLGGPCPPPAKQAVAGATRNIVICGRNHASVALTPQAGASLLGGSFIGAAGAFASRQAPVGFTGVLARWDGTTITTTPGMPLIVRTTIGSGPNATSPSTDLPSYNATPPVAPPVLTKTTPTSPSNVNFFRVFGTVAPSTMVKLYTNATCSSAVVASDTAAVFVLNGLAVSALDNTTTTYYATATDQFGTVSACSSGLAYVEDSASPAFAGVRTTTVLGPSSIRVGWQSASDTVTPAGAIVYDICSSSTPDGCTPFRTDFTSAAGVRSFDVTGLRHDTRHYFVVRARDQAGNQDANTVQVNARTLGIKSSVSVSAGRAHACALGADGVVTCWGSNGRGEVGNGTFSRSEPPTTVMFGATAVAASVGQFTCALLSDGRVRCWGLNDHGQLGDGTINARNSPTLVSGISTAVAIAVGGAHACALLANGTVACWGYNPFGELGDGTTNESHVPVMVSGLTDVKAIAAGTQHTCVIRAWGRIECWGYNEHGQVGDGTNDNRLAPVEVWAGKAIVAGHWHTCALAETGDVYCWGRGKQGEIGDGNTDDRNAPTLVSMPGNVMAIFAGGNWDSGWSCAVTAEGQARCWGANFEGNFGIGVITNETPNPQTLTSYIDVTTFSPGIRFGCFVNAFGVVFCAGRNDFGQLGNASAPNPSITPVAVDIVPRASMGAQISAGTAHTCATISDGTIRCWGSNGSGRLGDGTTTARPVPVTAVNVSNPRSVSAGGSHTCAVLADGTVRCWGLNSSGQLGDGTANPSARPVTVFGLSNIVSVAAGAAFTCALDVYGEVWCWGDDSFHQLGDGGSTARSTPVHVAQLSSVTAIAAGSNYMCALIMDGWVACWGDNSSGQLGPNATIGINQFGFSPGAVAIAAGDDHACAVLNDGTINCWGANAVGQLGDNTTNPTSQPVTVLGISNAKGIAVGRSHSCALLADTSVQCWGANSVGQLGNGSTTPVVGKVVVANLAATRLDAGLDHTCALSVDGTARCWGEGTDGQLGNGGMSGQSRWVLVKPFP
jgi:alpha-tubulin suppressor-like RCC1 family protein